MLLKLTGPHGETVFINTKNVCTFADLTSLPSNPNNQNMSVHDNYQPVGTRTFISFGNGGVHVREHIAEILALMEGKDPTPARILFGGKDER